MTELVGTELSFEKAVKKAFERSKSDISRNQGNITNLNKEINEIKKEISFLKQNQLNLGELVKSNNEKVAILIEQIDKLLSKHPFSSSGTGSKGSERVPIELRLVKQFQQNKAAIVKNKILSLLETKEFSAYGLYALIVEQEGLCGKTSFYRYLRDLERSDKVRVELKDSQRILSLRTGFI